MMSKSNKHIPRVVMPLGKDGPAPDFIELGFNLYELARTRAMEEGVSTRDALQEIACELPEPVRSAALGALDSLDKR